MATHQIQYVKEMKKIKLARGRMEGTEEIEVVYDEGESKVINTEESSEALSLGHVYYDNIDSERIYRNYTFLKNQHLNENKNTTELSKNNESSNAEVKIIDWTSLFSYGVGNAVFLLFVLLILVFSGINIYIYYIIGSFALKSLKEQQDSNSFYTYIGIILGSSMLLAVCYFINSLVFYTSSKKLHRVMVEKLLRAKMSFFDNTPIGSIVNKFSKDIQGIDDVLPNNAFLLIRLLGNILSSVIVMIIAVPFMLIPAFISLFILYYIKSKISKKLQSLQWYESECRAPINTKFGSAADGLMTIRSYKREDYFISNFLQTSNQLFCISFTYYGVRSYIRQLTDFVGFMLLLLNFVLIIIFQL